MNTNLSFKYKAHSLPDPFGFDCQEPIIIFPRTAHEFRCEVPAETDNVGAAFAEVREWTCDNWTCHHYSSLHEVGSCGFDGAGNVWQQGETLFVYITSTTCEKEAAMFRLRFDTAS